MCKKKLFVITIDKTEENHKILEEILYSIDAIYDICDKDFDGSVSIALEDKRMGRPVIMKHLENCHEFFKKLEDNDFEVRKVFDKEDRDGLRAVRNRSVHDYGGLDLSIIENVVNFYLPKIRNSVQNYLDENPLEEESSRPSF